ncbi:hypothetical protein FSP39_001341 [Pinctada imbricata]|uniref:Alpha-type protein kinase domain-containing protein n=1 Tax=Pinctada imbricata TaxID=66713 RepID=A0AA88XGT9_PINIB|nr:hypothetical protein FSP39_001341 [Pinctada imbricata]
MGKFSDLHASNQTLPSVTKCKEGEKWWATFEFYPESVGPKKSAFRGYMYVGANFWSQQSCVVKFKNSGSNFEKEFLDRIRECQESEDLASKFNTENVGPKLEIIVPLLATMDKASFLNGVFRFIKGYDLVIHSDDQVLIEKRIDGKFTTFVDKFGRCIQNCPAILQAFCHFTYHESKGKLVVTNIQGSLQNGKFVLSSPVIHSAATTYGPEDNGSVGIQTFFAHHKCNQICSGYLRPDHAVQQVTPCTYPIQVKHHFADDDDSTFSSFCSEPPPPYTFNESDKVKLLGENFRDIPGVHTI